MQCTRRQFGKTALAIGGASALSKLGFSQNKFSGANSLRAHAAARGLMYGAAIRPEFLDVDGFEAGKTSDPYTLLFADQCNIVVPESAMKWASLRPAPDKFDFTGADQVIRFAGLAHQKVRGHNLCWSAALPAWFNGVATKANARKLLTDHINTVAGRYRGKMHSWDVVNEAFKPDDGRPDGLRKSPWLELIGPDYIELAYTTAAQADPYAKLTYNETHFELDTPEETLKRGFVLAMLKRLKAKGVPIHAVGIQSHLVGTPPWPGSGLVWFIRQCRNLGLEAYVTELDVNCSRLPGGPELQDAAVAKVYRDYLHQVLPESNVPMVLNWGITSAHTYINVLKEAWLMRKDGVAQRPLPFDDRYQATPAFYALRDAIDAARPL
jgi:endo-1,4-beta-xylanase